MNEIHPIGTMTTMECWLCTGGGPNKAVRVGRIRIGETLVRVQNPFQVQVHERRFVRIPDADVAQAGGYDVVATYAGEQLRRWCPAPDPRYPGAIWYPRALFRRTQFDTEDGEIHEGEFYRQGEEVVWHENGEHIARATDVEIVGSGASVTIRERSADGRRG